MLLRLQQLCASTANARRSAKWHGGPGVQCSMDITLQQCTPMRAAGLAFPGALRSSR